MVVTNRMSSANLGGVDGDFLFSFSEFYSPFLDSPWSGVCSQKYLEIQLGRFTASLACRLMEGIFCCNKNPKHSNAMGNVV